MDGCTGRAGDDLLGQTVAPTGLPSAGGEAVEVSATLATAFARLGHVLLQLLAQGLVGRILIIFGLFGCFTHAGSCLAGRILVLFSVLSLIVL